MPTHRIHITGIVQGVGMRPFVYREAVARDLAGWVLNAGDGVHAEATGPAGALADFERALREDAPAAARVEHVHVEKTDEDGFLACDGATCDAAAGDTRGAAFRIVASDGAGARTTLVSPDIATCPDCVRELFDPADRRYHYPFINCTNCGPRYTIIDGLPYDRPLTSMGAFPMCPTCAAEYADPADRRFHAQPDACFDCGPHITWRERADAGATALVGRTVELSDVIIERCAELLQDGGIAAIKGLGGFHLACDAADEVAVRELRRRKRRSNKPLAVMVPSVSYAEELCEADDTERALLSGSVRPIVLLRRHVGEGQGARHLAEAHLLRGQGVAGSNRAVPAGRFALARSVAFDLPELGVMLPYSPLQHLLLATCEKRGMHALVMTSGNLSEEPIETDDALAWEHLVASGIADALLGNDRAILTRYDDSVVRVVDGHAMPVRRARGYAPQPLALPAVGARGDGAARGDSAARGDGAAHGDSTPDDRCDDGSSAPCGAAPVILACGSEQKATIALTREGGAGGAACFISQHIGDVENGETFDAWHDCLRRMETLFDLTPTVLACDLHPSYLPSQWAREHARAMDMPLVEVQHHHAHIASVIAEAAAAGEHDPASPVVGLAFDGTGAGTDGTVWGGEVLVCDLTGFTRAAHLAPWRLPGGAASVRDARRNAYSLLMSCGFAEHPGAASLVGSLDDATRQVTRTMVERGLNSPLTSSMGRLLDATAALVGICGQATYEGEPAIRLEAAAWRALEGSIQHGNTPQGPLVDGDTCEEAQKPTPKWSKFPGIGSNCTTLVGVFGDVASTPGQPDLPFAIRRSARAVPSTHTGERQAKIEYVLDPAQLLKGVLHGIQAGRAPELIALDVHRAVAVMAAATAARVASDANLDAVALSGGVWMNRLLLQMTCALLHERGLKVLVPTTVPVNDGCIAYGQAAIARARIL